MAQQSPARQVEEFSAPYLLIQWGMQKEDMLNMTFLIDARE